MLIPAVFLAVQVGAHAPAVPFGVGERLEYGGKMGIIRTGEAVLLVEGIETMRTHPSWKFSFTTKVNFGIYRNNTALRSWTGTSDWISRQFVKDISENGRDRLETFRIYPDSGFYRRNANTETKTTPQAPLDDVAFFYWVRTIPLEVGQTYRFNNYFRDEHNPVIIRVEKREVRELFDGTKVPMLLLRPIVNEDGGMFHEKSKAKLWITDDARRLPVEIQSNLIVGNLTLELRAYTPGRE